MSTLAENWLPRHRLSVDEYYRMAAVGLLRADARVELIDGEIIDMAPIVSAHAGTVDQLCAAITRAVGGNAIVGVQRPIRLDARTEPQPDVILLRPRTDFYRGGHPTGADVLLVVEVSDSTLRYDRDVKMSLYAQHGIAEAWLVDIGARLLHILRGPASGGYTQSSVTAVPGVLPLAAMPDVAIDLSGLLEL